MIELKNVSFGYEPGKPILDKLSIAVSDDECIAVMGKSGIGKTTLLRLLAGLEKPTAGSIIGLESVRISIAFQENRLFPWYDALKNVTIVTDKSDEAKASELLDRLGLSDCMNRFPSELSGGQQRRLAIARALYYGGDVLLLDEPFTGLDAELKRKAAALICESFRTIILVTHDETEAKLIGCQRAITLN